ncbi:MAG: ABC transporter ATP-binding protein [Candidatus Woesearchaeota archaeon]
MNDTLVHMENVWKVYRMGEVDVPALRGIDLEIKRGEFIAIIGQSGSGKSTMMNLIGCLDTPTKGRILLKSRDINKLSESDLATLRGKTVGFIFQQYNLMPNLTALANVLLPMEFQEIGDDVAEKRARDMLKLVGLSEKMYNLPSQLSGGQQQRVCIARCLVTNPEIILADEPTGALDSVSGLELMKMLHKLWKEEGRTILMVTHDYGLAEYAHKHIVLRDGKIIDIKHNGKIKEVRL